MNARFNFVLVTFALLLQSGIFSIPSPALQSAPQSVLVAFPNSDFETNPTSGSGWSWPGSDWTWDDSVAHGGSHSARVYRGSGSETASLWSVSLPVQPSTLYTLTFWLRTQNATSWPSMRVYQFAGGGSQTGPALLVHSDINPGVSSWSPMTFRFQTMPNAASVQLRIYVWSSTTGTFWFDDFSLNEQGPAIYPFHPAFPLVGATGSVHYSSPVVADIDNDGSKEVLAAIGNAVAGWEQDGTPLPGFPLGTNDKHIQGQIAVADLDGDRNLEIVAGTKTAVYDGQARVFVWRHTGALMPGWPKNVAWDTQYSHNESWVSSVALADIDGDGALEILASTTNNATDFPGDPDYPPTIPNLYAWNPDGSLVSGNWPNWHRIAGFYGIIAAGDLNGDHVADVIAARDHHFVNAYSGGGVPLPGWPITTYLYRNTGNYHTDYRLEHTTSAPVLADLDGDGVTEYMVCALQSGPGNDNVSYINNVLLTLEPDGTRRPGWESPAMGSGMLAQQDLPPLAPAIADLNRDGRLEVIVASHDGWIRAYTADKAVLWAYKYASDGDMISGEPAVGDIDGDGSPEVLFGTYATRQWELQNNAPVGLWALKSDGTVKSGFPLPVPTPGMRGAPTLADLDGNGKLEIVISTIEGQVFAWDTGSVYDPTRLPWPTGRHDLRRSATYSPLNPLEGSAISVSSAMLDQGETATYTIRVSNASQTSETTTVSDPIPAGLSYVPGSLTASAGAASISGGVIQWNGNIGGAASVEISYDVVVATSASQVIRNSVEIDSAGVKLTRSVDLFANYQFIYLPITKR